MKLLLARSIWLHSIVSNLSIFITSLQKYLHFKDKKWLIEHFVFYGRILDMIYMLKRYVF